MGKSTVPAATNGSAATLTEHASHLAVGTLQIFLASAVSLPTGLLTAAFLTRRLGPIDYGLLTVTATIIVWIEGTLTVGLSRSAITCLAKAKDWQAVSAKFLQVQLLLGLGATALLVAVAPLLSSWLASHEMTRYLRIYALSIPLTAAGSIHQAVLIGHGRFGHRAIIIVVYWLSRMLLIFLFVSYRASVTWAILASLGSSFIVLVWARALVRPPLFLRSDFPFRKLWNYAWPLFIFTVGINLFKTFDILFVKAISPLPQVTGYFAAAKNLTIIPALFGAAFSPLLLAKLTHLKAVGRTPDAKVLTGHAMRFVLCLLPFAAIAAGASSELVTAIYGAPFLPAAPFLTLLIFAALAVAMISVMVSTLIAVGRPHLPVLLVGPLVAIAPLMHYVAVCRFGPLGAAATTAGLSCIGAVVTVLAVYRIWQVLPSFATLVRILFVAGIAFAFAYAWPAPGLQLLVKIPVIGLFIVLAFFFLGEIRQRDIIFARSLFPGRSGD